MTKIDENLISKLEKLAKLRLKSDEKEQISEDLEQIIGMFDKLQEVNTEGVSPTSHMTSHEHPLRDDTVANELRVDEVLDNAPKSMDSFIAVPKFLKPKS